MGFGRLGDQLQLLDLLSDTHSALLGKDDTGEVLAAPLTAASLHHEIGVVAEQHPIEGGESIQEIRIFQIVRSIFECGQEINAAEP